MAFPRGGVTIMPSTGGVTTSPDSLASSFDRDFETRTPYFYKGLLEDYNTTVSYTLGKDGIQPHCWYILTRDWIMSSCWPGLRRSWSGCSHLNVSHIWSFV